MRVRKQIVLQRRHVNMSKKKIHFISGQSIWNPDRVSFDRISRSDSCGSPGYEYFEEFTYSVYRRQRNLARAVYSIDFHEELAPYHLIRATYPKEVAYTVPIAQLSQSIVRFNGELRRIDPAGFSLYIIEFSPLLGYYVHWLSNVSTQILERSAKLWWANDSEDPEGLVTVESFDNKQDFYDCRAELFRTSAYMGRAKVAETILSMRSYGFVNEYNCPTIRHGEYELTQDDFRLQGGLIIADLLPCISLAEALQWESSIPRDGAERMPRRCNRPAADVHGDRLRSQRDEPRY
jgi:hypothetical protein